jgi:hypothetical protein
LLDKTLKMMGNADKFKDLEIEMEDIKKKLS